MFVNVWIGIPETDHNELNNRRGTENNIGPAKQFVNGQLDPAVVQNLYKTRQQGQTIFHLWSVILSEADGPYNLQIAAFRQEFPGARVEGAWLPDGSQLLDELGDIRYPLNLANLLDYMPDVWNGDDPPTFSPATVVTDVNLPAGWAPRDFTAAP